MGSKKRVVAKAKSPAVQPKATPAKKSAAKKSAAKRPAAKKSAAKKPATHAKPKTSAADSLRAALSHLELLCSAHPGLLLEGDERATQIDAEPPIDAGTASDAEPDAGERCSTVLQQGTETQVMGSIGKPLAPLGGNVPDGTYVIVGTTLYGPSIVAGPVFRHLRQRRRRSDGRTDVHPTMTSARLFG